MKEFFYTITESMLDLGLRGTELNLFAVIYGYSQKGDGCCYATRAELAHRCGVSSIRTIDITLASLIEKGLIRKFTINKDGQFLTAYGRGANSAGGVQKLHGGCAKIARGGCANSAHKENKDIENINENKTPLPPTHQEVAAYAKERGFRDPEGFAIHYIEEMQARNWTYGREKKIPVIDWKGNMRQWERYDKEKDFSYLKASASISSQMSEASFLNFIDK